MESIFEFDISSIVYPHLEKHEQQLTLNLWYCVFKKNSGFYERYFLPDTSPHYRESDTLGAWHHDKLVSTVHIRRLILESSENNQK